MGARLNGWEPTIFAEPDSDLSGTDDAQVVQHERRLGIWWNWVACASSLLADNPTATHILTLQDDCVLVPNARRLMEEFITRWPADCGLVSLYLPKRHSQDRKRRRRLPGIHPAKDKVFMGSLAVVYQRERLEKILTNRIAVRWGKSSRFPEKIIDDDICVGYCIKDMRLKLYYTFPSCSQHISQHSTRGRGDAAAVGDRAASWVAVDALEDCR